jgi:hypothetical protein
MKTAVEIYKLLPKTNCAKCGMPNCFGFATKVAAGLASITACTTLSDSVRQEILAEEQARKGSRGTVYEQALESIWPRVAALDFPSVAKRLGLTLSGTDRLMVEFLNERYTVTRDRILGPDEKEPLPFISILILNHLCMPHPPPPSGEWITFGSVPASHAKDKAWAGHVEEVIAKHFAGNVAGLGVACERMGGVKAEVKGNHDAAYEFRFFPHYPALLLFYDTVSEEDFPAQVKVLLDKYVDRYLDIESIVVLGEEFASRMTA